MQVLITSELLITSVITDYALYNFIPLWDWWNNTELISPSLHLFSYPKEEFQKLETVKIIGGWTECRKTWLQGLFEHH